MLIQEKSPTGKKGLNPYPKRKKKLPSLAYIMDKIVEFNDKPNESKINQSSIDCS